MNQNKDEVVVSVLMATYNHERFLETAVRSVMDQHWDYEFELLIADDCSSDSTTEIIKHYQRLFPANIRPILRQENIGYQKNYLDALRRCRGRYVAHLDGDDFWVARNKTAQQIAALESNPDCVLCFSKCIQFYDGSATVPHLFPDLEPGKFTLSDLLAWDFIPTSTVIFRRSLEFAIPQWLEVLPTMDWGLWSIMSQSGSLLFLPETLGAYRKHVNGVWTSKSITQQIDADELYYKQMLSYLPSRFHHLIKRGLDKTANRRPQTVSQ
jgi:Glycosyl transferase family 2